MIEFSQNNEMLDRFDVIGSVEPGIPQYMTFELNQEHYGVDILRVQEIKGWTRVTPIPNTPTHLCGVLNLRGAIVPIVDLRLLFDMPFEPYTKTTVVIVLNVQGYTRRTVGIVVDAVSDAHNVKQEDIKSAPDFGEQLNTGFISGMTHIGDNMVTLLDIDTLLSSEQIG
ncbi:chemotaxis protein CheW [Methylophaga sp. OBS1]|jgi:purine-binding chemotaxis protein CheW|uniref:chemotaxis protein CheW n=1 Tax=Methylophaga sp. OBS1 TaxID=2991933 RepID=UPI002251365C|nr:chemotaxis protein CheW [Methylophaga sp. OBS1]MCX4193870.1 chemotaxis protein CheW [Methylophaga sp. OBS1]